MTIAVCSFHGNDVVYRYCCPGAFVGARVRRPTGTATVVRLELGRPGWNYLRAELLDSPTKGPTVNTHIEDLETRLAAAKEDDKRHRKTLKRMSKETKERERLRRVAMEALEAMASTGNVQACVELLRVVDGGNTWTKPAGASAVTIAAHYGGGAGGGKSRLWQDMDDSISPQF